MINEFKIEHCHYIPKDIKEGIIYISKEFKLAMHLCACGCGGKTVMPTDISAGGWSMLEESDGTVSFRPSIGNFSGENPYHAHYFIVKNKVQWCEPPRPIIKMMQSRS